MKSVMVLFSGLPNGWVGKRENYTLTVKINESEKDVNTALLVELSKTHRVEKVVRARELKAKSI